MPVEFRCPQCGKLLRTPDASAGKKGRCPHCQAITDIPLASTVSPAGNLPSAAPTTPATPDLFANRPAATPTPSAQTPDLFASVPTPAPASGPDLFANVPGSTAPPQDKAQALFADPLGPSPPGDAYGGGGYGGGYGGGGAPAYGGGGYAPAKPYGGPSYAAPQPPYGHYAGQSHRGPLVLTLGILSLVGSLGGIALSCCCAPAFAPFGLVGLMVELLTLVAGIPACVFGAIDLRKMNQGDMDPSGQGMTVTGFVMGIIAVVIAVLYLLFVIIMFAVVGVAMFSSQAMQPPRRF